MGGNWRNKEDMKRVLEVISTTLIEGHLRRNPRVVSYSGDEVLLVEYDSSIPIPRIISAEARGLGLPELGCDPYVTRGTEGEDRQCQR